MPSVCIGIIIVVFAKRPDAIIEIVEDNEQPGKGTNCGDILDGIMSSGRSCRMDGLNVGTRARIIYVRFVNNEAILQTDRHSSVTLSFKRNA